MSKMEIELTDEQMEKVKQLEAQNITVGQAIDMLFELKEKALPEIEKLEKSGLLEVDVTLKLKTWTETMVIPKKPMKWKFKI